jgi:putative spermidine/putrescine transport system permease protein
VAPAVAPAASGPGAGPAGPRPGRNRWGWLALPGVAFLLLSFAVPLGDVAWRSLTDPSPASYLVFGESSVYGRTLLTTFRTAGVVTVACLLLGYPYAYAMHQAGRRAATVLGLLVLLPFWSSPLVRSFAWAALLEDNGIINSLLGRLGADPWPLMRNTFGVTVGMTHILLPFMVLPLYAAMRRVDGDLVRAAGSLGARPLAAFRRVFVPLTLPGVMAGSLLVFVLSLGFFIVPAMLGSPRNAMFSELIVTEITVLLKFGVGSAMGIVLLVITLGLLWLGSRVVKLEQVLGYDIR